MKIKVIYLSAFLLLLAACNGIQVSEKLEYIDSLIVREQYDSASVLLQDVAETKKTEEEQAHYYLLSTQLGFLTNQPLPSDSLLDLAIEYYKKVENYQDLANAYIYKSYRLRINQDYPQAILYGKEAERLVKRINEDRLQFKIAENLSYLNGLCENDLLQLQYAMNALTLAKKVQNKNWIVYSYNKISFAFYNLGQYDSAFVYVERSIPYFDNVYDFDKAGFLTNIGRLFKEKDTEKAKYYLYKALDYDELPETYEHLADVYYAEGDKEEAYRLWKKALTKDSRYEKDNLIYSILSYDLEHGNIEEASKNLDEVIAIKDSIITVLRNDTIKDLQLRFDHEVAMHEVDKKLINTQWILFALVLIAGVMTLYIIIRRKKTETLQREHQMRLYAYTTEINQLKANKDNTLNRIRDLESRTDKDSIRINELEEEAKKADLAIQTLNKSIKKLLDDEAPKLKKGRMLYDHILEGGTTSRWSSKEENLFNNYYAAINYQSYNRLKRVKRTTKLSAHNLFYLILKEMGKSDEEVRRILGLSLEGLRTIRSRTKPIE